MMIKEKVLRFITVFICSIILSLPFYTSAVYAGLSHPLVYGKGLSSSKAGFIRDNDDLATFQVNANITGDSVISASQISLDNSESEVFFGSCSHIGGGTYTCYLTLNLSDYHEANLCDYYNGYVLNLYNDANSKVDTISTYSICDVNIPVIEQLSVEDDDVKENDEIVFYFTATDSATDSYPNRCSGFSRAVLYSGQYTTGNIWLNGKSDVCLYEGNITIDASDISQEGDVVFRLKVYDNFDHPSLDKSVTVSIDKSVPEIRLKNYSIKDGNGNTVLFMEDKYVKLSFSVEIDEDNLDVQSVFADMTNIGVIDYLDPSSCNEEDEYTVCSWNNVAFHLNKTILDNPVKIYASDTNGNDKTQSILFNADIGDDTYGPSVKNVFIKDLSGNLISGYVKPELFNGLFYVNFSDSGTGVDHDSPCVNLTELNDLSSNVYLCASSAKCEDEGDNTLCSWQTNFLIIEEGTKEIEIVAADNAGNAAMHTVSFFMGIDEEGPVFEKVLTNNGKEYIKPKNNDIVLVFDDDSGMSPETTFIDLSNLGLSTVFNADNCSLHGEKWYCYFGDVSLTKDFVEGSTYTVSVAPSTKDKLGNIIDERAYFDLTIDKNAPVLQEVVFDPLYPNTGQSLTMTLQFDDVSGIYEGSIDASSVSSETFPKDMTCSGNQCTITIRNLQEGNNSVVYFTVEDYAGNSINDSFEMDVFVPDYSTVPNYVSTSILDISPPKIDRKAASTLSYPVFVTVELDYDRDTLVYDKSISCDSPAGSEVLLDEDSDIPIINFRLASGTYDEESLTIPCELQLYVVHDGVLYGLPETEYIDVDLGLYNIPLGDVDENIQDKIDEIDDKIKSLQSDIQSLESVVSIWGTICSIAELMHKLNSLQQSIKSLMWGILIITEKNPFTTAQSCGTWAAICETTSSFSNFVEYFVWPSGFNLMSPALYYMKLPCMVFFHCALCDINALSNIGADLFSEVFPSEMIADTVGVDMDTGESFSVDDEYYNMRISSSSMDYNNYLSEDRGIFGLFEISNVDLAYSSLIEMEGEWTEDFLQVNHDVVESDKWLFNPYKSKHYASTCMCLPAQVYNLKKEREINCMQKTCLEGALANGMPTDSCSKSFQERYCLYVEGAEWKKGVAFSDALSSLFISLALKIAMNVAGDILTDTACETYVASALIGCTCPSDPMASGNVMCGLSLSVKALLGIVNTAQSIFSFDNYDQELEGNYCGDAETEESGGWFF